MQRALLALAPSHAFAAERAYTCAHSFVVDALFVGKWLNAMMHMQFRVQHQPQCEGIQQDTA